MAVTYDKIAYPLIENGLKKLIDDEFQNVYISPVFTMIGNECIRINLVGSDNIETHHNYERRSYQVNIRCYFNGDMSSPNVNESVKGKIDRLKKHLIDNQNKNTASATWVELTINSIDYDITDDDNEDAPEIYIAEFNLELINHNPF